MSFTLVLGLCWALAALVIVAAMATPYGPSVSPRVVLVILLTAPISVPALVVVGLLARHRRGS